MGVKFLPKGAQKYARGLRKCPICGERVHAKELLFHTNECSPLYEKHLNDVSVPHPWSLSPKFRISYYHFVYDTLKYAIGLRSQMCSLSSAHEPLWVESEVSNVYMDLEKFCANATAEDAFAHSLHRDVFLNYAEAMLDFPIKILPEIEHLFPAAINTGRIDLARLLAVRGSEECRYQRYMKWPKTATARRNCV